LSVKGAKVAGREQQRWRLCSNHPLETEHYDNRQMFLRYM